MFQTTCTMTFTSSSVKGEYGIAILIEDFLSSSSQTPLSSVPLQFLIDVKDLPAGCSNQKPKLVAPSPTSGSELTAYVGNPYNAEVRARATSANEPYVTLYSLLLLLLFYGVPYQCLSIKCHTLSDLTFTTSAFKLSMLVKFLLFKVFKL